MTRPTENNALDDCSSVPAASLQKFLDLGPAPMAVLADGGTVVACNNAFQNYFIAYSDQQLKNYLQQVLSRCSLAHDPFGKACAGLLLPDNPGEAVLSLSEQVSGKKLFLYTARPAERVLPVSRRSTTTKLWPDSHGPFSPTERKAYFDSLTGLPNRNGLEEYEASLKRQRNRNFRKGSLIFADLVKFKTINDTLGYATGDQVLTLAGSVLSACFRNHDLVARYGGDEFVILMPACPTDVAAERLSRLHDLFVNQLKSEFGDAIRTHFHSGICEFDAKRGVSIAIEQASSTCHAGKSR
ncbi:MAG: GGDEF domain-containing protein [Planctomycetia bacterium]|nr:GGDEF domain-containing protein [Planctomycetia bacterium]